MASILSAPCIQNEAAAYAKLESIAGTDGPVCFYYGNTERIERMGGIGFESIHIAPPITYQDSSCVP